MTGTPRIAVIGAGITGLVAGLELANRGARVDIFERWPEVGGQAGTFDVGGGVRIERFPQHLDESDAEMISLHERFVPGELEWHRPSSGVFANARVWPLGDLLDLARFSLIRPSDRLRLGLAIARLRRRTGWEELDDLAALDWLRREVGITTTDRVWAPLLAARFGDRAETVPLAWLWSRVRRSDTMPGRSARRPLLGYPRYSLQRICVVLADEVRRLGGEVHLDRTVLRVEAVDGRHRLRFAPPGAFRLPLDLAGAPLDAVEYADAVLFTTPSAITRRVFSWSGPYDRSLPDPAYRAAVVLLIELRRRFTKKYAIDVVAPDMPFHSLVEHTNLGPPGRYPAHYLHVVSYASPDSLLLRMTTAELLGHCLPGLQRISRRFAYRDVMRSWSFREPAALPVPRLGQRHRRLETATPVPGLYVANTSQVYPDDPRTDHGVRLGRDAAVAIWDDLHA